MAISKLVILDAGHNEKVAGKESPCKTLREWKFNDDMQKLLVERCKDHGISTYLTNPNPAGKDEIGLATRCNLANNYYKNNGKPKTIFISLHANAYSNYSVRGTETFTASNASSASKNFAKDLNSEIVKAMKAIDSGAKDRGHKTENFYVIKNTITPCCLVEYGFYSNKADLAILKNNKKQLVEATMKAICKYFGVTYKAPTTASTPSSGTTYYRAVAGSYTVRANADEQVAKLKAKGYSPFLDAFEKDGKKYLRVVVCSNTVRKSTEEVIAKLKSQGFDADLMIYKK